MQAVLRVLFGQTVQYPTGSVDRIGTGRSRQKHIDADPQTALTLIRWVRRRRRRRRQQRAMAPSFGVAPSLKRDKPFSLPAPQAGSGWCPTFQPLSNLGFFFLVESFSKAGMKGMERSKINGDRDKNPPEWRTAPLAEQRPQRNIARELELAKLPCLSSLGGWTCSEGT